MILGAMMIPHNQPWVTAEDRAAVDAVLASGWIAQGAAVAELEANFVQRYGQGAACAVSSGTAALFLALNALGAARQTRVAVPTYTCSALLNAIHMTGATPVLADVSPTSFCIDPAALSRQAAAADVVIAVHTYGEPADVASIQHATRKVLEDCCHSLGGEGRLGSLGNQGDAAIFSFYATKIVTGGQGGLVWSKSDSLVNAVLDYRQFDCREDYVPRFNLQMTDIQGALINSQMKRLAFIRDRRQAMARTYLDALPNGLSTQSGLLDAGRMVYRFVVLAPDSVTRESLRRHMQQAGISCAVPIERHELLHRYMKLDPDEFPVAEKLADTSLSLPIHPGLSEAQVEKIAKALKEFRP